MSLSARFGAAMRAAAMSVAAATMLSGCMEWLQEPELVRPGAPLGMVEVRNQSTRTVTDLRAGPCCDRHGYATSYSDGLLARRETVAPGGSFRFPASAGSYSIRAVTSSGGLLSGGREHFGIIQVDPGRESVTVWVVQ
ncbi:MAG: hypothetical protein JJT95_18040 [Pararhodobacter sp.]|nr:hypothetical protein [Pararhodobacter sp.]